MRNAKCSICGFVRPGEESLRHCPSCGARAIFAVATSDPVSPRPHRSGPEHGALFFPSHGSCLNFD